MLWYTESVKNLTLAIDDQILKRARLRALQEDTSVNAVVGSFLGAYAGLAESDAEGPIESVIAHSMSVSAGSGSSGRSWRREDIYDRT